MKKKVFTWISLVMVLLLMITTGLGCRLVDQKSELVEKKPSEIQVRQGQKLEFEMVNLTKKLGSEYYAAGDYHTIQYWQDHLVMIENRTLLLTDIVNDKTKAYPIVEPTGYQEDIDTHRVWPIEYYIEEIIQERYALICGQADLYSQSQAEVSHGKKYYYGIFDLEMGKPVGDYVTFESKVPMKLQTSGLFYISVSEVHSDGAYIIGIDIKQGKQVQTLYPNDPQYTKIHNRMYDFDSRDNAAYNYDKSKLVIADSEDACFYVKDLESKATQSVAWANPEADSGWAGFYSSDRLLLQRMMTYETPDYVTEADIEEGLEYEDITVYEFFITDLDAGTTTKINFANQAATPEDMEVGEGLVQWLDYLKEDSYAYVQEYYQDGAIYRNTFTFPLEMEESYIFTRENGKKLLVIDSEEGLHYFK